MKQSALYQQSVVSNQSSAVKADSRKLKAENFSSGFSSLAAVALMGLLMALFLGLVGTGVVKFPGSAGIPTSPIPFSDPVEDDTACNDEFNADCEKFLENDPEDLTPKQIQKGSEE